MWAFVSPLKDPSHFKRWGWVAGLIDITTTSTRTDLSNNKITRNSLYVSLHQFLSSGLGAFKDRFVGRSVGRSVRKSVRT